MNDCIESSRPLWGPGPRSNRVLRMRTRGGNRGRTGWSTRCGTRGAKVVLGITISFIFVSTMTAFAVHDRRRAAVKKSQFHEGHATWRRNTHYLILPCRMKRSMEFHEMQM
ncbi:hypothetical protein J3R83DRAFT_12000 [Lanmaoa asiatica]|nr:hypothetical protein J3R83DRAFT_12000 [Lanmaoa asiatica]